MVRKNIERRIKERMNNAVYEINCEVTGFRPLLQNDLNAMELDAKATVAKKGQVYEPEEEAVKRLTVNAEGVVCQRATHFEAAMVKAATSFKFQGMKTYKDLFKAGVFVEPLLIPHIIQEWVIDTQFVKIGAARVPRCRPRFDNWKLAFIISVTDDRIPPAVLKEILMEAGRSQGVGDYRPRYGLFDITNWELIKEAIPVEDVILDEAA